MSNGITRQEFDAFKTQIVPKVEFNLFKQKLDALERAIRTTRADHYSLKEDIRDWQAEGRTQDELLKAALKPLFREDDKGTTLIVNLKDLPEIKSKADKLWLIFKIGSGIGGLITTAIGVAAALS